MAVLPDGRVVIGSQDKTVRIWNPSSGECERVLEGHTLVSRWLSPYLRVGFVYLYVCVFMLTCFNDNSTLIFSPSTTWGLRYEPVVCLSIMVFTERVVGGCSS